MGPTHDQESWKDVDEHPPHPWGHGVGLGGAEVDVEHDHRHAYARREESRTVISSLILC